MPRSKRSRRLRERMARLKHEAKVMISPQVKRGAINRVALAAMAGVACLGIALVAYQFSKSSKPLANKGNNATESQDSKTIDKEPTANALPPGWVVVGGVARPSTDIDPKKVEHSESSLPTKVLHGFSPPVKPDANKQVEYVYAALKDRSNPNAYSSFVSAKEFDVAAYQADPDRYINEVEPSRVYSPAQPGEGIPVIRANGSRYHGVKQGEVVTLEVEASASAPVTFASSSLGYFENQLTSITVKADEKGIAKANFTAGGGTIDDVKILAASPMTSGQVAFTVNVSLPGS